MRLEQLERRDDQRTVLCPLPADAYARAGEQIRRRAHEAKSDAPIRGKEKVQYAAAFIRVLNEHFHGALEHFYLICLSGGRDSRTESRFRGRARADQHERRDVEEPHRIQLYLN